MDPLISHLIYGLAWLSFGAGHSLLAGSGPNTLLRRAFGGAYRLAFNAVAVVHLGLVWGVGWAVFRGTPAFALPAAAETALTVLSVAGWVAMVAGLAGYDLGRLGGTRQWRAARRGDHEPADEPLRRDGLHRYVRHPLYAAGFLILWGRVGDPFALATAIWGSLYLVVGAAIEERRLLRLYGEAYAAYRRRVPAFVPWRGRAL